MTTRHGRSIFIAVFFIAAAVLVALMANPRQLPSITLALENVSITNHLQSEQPLAVFVVTNAGRKAAWLSFDAMDFRDKDGRLRSMSLPVLGIFGQCSVPPGTNCIVTIRGPNHSGPWRVHATVFLPSSVYEKARFAVGRLRTRLLGKANYKTFWIGNMSSAAYKVCSPEVPALFPPSVAVEAPPTDSTPFTATNFVIQHSEVGFDWYIGDVMVGSFRSPATN